MKHSKTKKPDTSLRNVFAAAASMSPVEKKLSRRKKRPSTYITVRVTPEEKEKLRIDAGSLTLSDFVRSKVLGDAVKPRKSRGRYVLKDKRSLALILRTIGGAQFSNRMHRLVLAHEENRLGLDEDLAKELRSMAWDIATIRNALVKALGLKPLPPPGSADHVTYETAKD